MIRVSAIIPVYNGAATIGRAIESVLSQQFGGLEVIVVDDGSTDSTIEVLENWGTRLKVVRRANGGPSAARNTGARIAEGEYLAFLDADDEWLPGKLEKTFGALDAMPGAALAYSNVKFVDALGRKQKDSFVTPQCDHAPSMDEMLTRWWPILTSTVVMRRKIFDLCGGFHESFRSAGYEDPYLWLRAREHGDFVYVPEPLVIYRIEPDLERLQKYAAGCATFVQLVRARYGAAGAALIREVIASQVSSLGYEGLLAMKRGDRKHARRAFMLALRYEASLRNILRLLRTLLPAAAARALTGRTRGQEQR
jgi:glycosyltransferase involved in cell wall biosynthesis